MKNPITPCLWFDHQAEEAANFYTSVFRNSKIENTSYYGNEGQEIHGQKEGTVLTVVFQINGQKFMALNGGPIFQFNQAVSFVVNCDTQEEIDYYWEQLSAVPEAGQCGWLKDKYGVSWQIVPTVLGELMADAERAPRVMKAFLQMKKFDIEKLKNA